MTKVRFDYERNTFIGYADLTFKEFIYSLGYSDADITKLKDHIPTYILSHL